MRIQSRFLLGFIAIAAPGLALSAWFASDAWRDSARAERATRATQVFSDIGRAQSAFAVQTGNLTVALRAPTPDLAGMRQTHEAAMERLAAATRSMAAAGTDATVVREATTALEELMRRVTAASAQPVPARDPALLQEVLARRADLSTRLNAIGGEAARIVTTTAPDVAPFIEVALHAMTLREVAGRRALGVSPWVGGAPIQPEALEGLVELSGRVAESVANIERLVEASGAPRLTRALEEQKRLLGQEADPYWRSFLRVARARLQPATANTPWPQDTAAFSAYTIRTLARLLDMRDAALDEALERAAAADASARFQLGVSVAGMVLTAALMAAALVMLLRGMVAPLGQLTGTVRRIGEGELTLAVPARERPDELGEMARAVDQLRLASLEREALEAAQKQEQAARLDRAQRVDALLREFEAETADVLRAVAAAATELDATATSMASTAADGTQRAGAVARSSAEASASVGSVAAATEELSASIGEVLRQVEASTRTAQQATEAAERTDVTVRGLSEAASRIGDVVRLIGDIAGQTNLLALNATIEAARAGEAGKGFAVVASEVKALAAQTAKATEEIGAQIAAMQAETGRTVEVVRAIAGTIEALNRNTAQVAEAASQQAEATQEIGRAAAAAAQGTQEASRHAEGVSEGAEQTGQSAAEVRGASAELARQAEGLRGRVDHFLGAIRAA
ncbi:methyl-accepting chemotaxis protein [Roseomonas stagni]|uniref:Methyl-accepting chemotaxis protein n=1 Tax=Falsiroseomonas algicola TaxID=2716930 RepID=A0A6M1LN62_9PROT|nr:methyl-accepting chemotaxis protein [Falsiroseomonas algicola]NGM21788.1 methyl-accepting chemotaxis protein [Falsiroseomonas algicola]